MTISNEIIKVLDALAERLGVVVDWTAANVIPYIEELCGKYINYEITTSVVWLVLALVFCIPSFVLFRALNKNKDFGVDHYHTIPDDYIGRIFAYVGVAALLVIPVVIIVTQIFDIVTCLSFPEMVIITELRDLIQ